MIKFGRKTPIFKQPFLHFLAYLDQNSRKILLTGRINITDRYLDRFWTAFRLFKARFKTVVDRYRPVLDHFLDRV